MGDLGVLILKGPIKKEMFKSSSFNGASVKFYTPDEDYDPSEIGLIIGYRINRELLWSLPNLKLIYIPFAGVDILDLSLIKERGVPLANSHTNARAVSEFAVTLLFSLVKKIPAFDRYMRKGIWKGRWEGDILDDLYGSTVTILGFGSIGKEIAHMLSPFGMDIFAIKRTLSGREREDYPFIKEFGTQDRLLEFLKLSNILIVSLPLTKETEGLIGREALDALGYGYLVNISRGRIVDEEKLYRHLKEGKLKGAAIDVWWNYPKGKNLNVYPSKFPFWQLDNVVMTPHTAGVTYNFLDRIKDEAISLINGLIHGKLPDTLVDLDREY